MREFKEETYEKFVKKFEFVVESRSRNDKKTSIYTRPLDLHHRFPLMKEKTPAKKLLIKIANLCVPPT
jgi:hypothetical protein